MKENVFKKITNKLSLIPEYLDEFLVLKVQNLILLLLYHDPNIQEILNFNFQLIILILTYNNKVK
jgi:hypothetical protein